MTLTIGRRQFISALGTTVAAWPLAARAQQPERMRRIGVLMNLAENDPEGQENIAAFLDRARQLGWVEGRNLQIEYRWTIGSPDRARAFAAELVNAKPDVILGNGGTALTALTQATRLVPIVFVAGIDPVALGIVSSLARPGGNATGFSAHERTVGGKWLDLLREIAPKVTRVTILNFDNPSSSVVLPMLEAAAASLNVEASVAHVHDGAEIERAINASAAASNAGLLVLSGTIGTVHRDLIIALAARSRLPAIYPSKVFSRSGGLFSYGFDRADDFRKAASYVDRILKGEMPADLPVQLTTKFDLTINLKTAKALGLTVPNTLLVSADEVIE